MDVLKPESFYKEAHQKIFQAVADLSTRLEPIDLYTVTEELRKNGVLDEVGGPVYIAQLTSKVGSAAHIDFHGNPELTSAGTKAVAPGRHSTSIPCSRQVRTNRNPGSDIPGVPASEIRATVSPAAILEAIYSVVLCSLNL